MIALLLSTLLLQAPPPPAGAPDRPTERVAPPVASGTMPDVDGAYTVVSMETDGRATPMGAHATVTIRRGVLTFGDEPGLSGGSRVDRRREDATPSGSVGRRQWRLDFGPHNTVRAVPLGGTPALDPAATNEGRAAGAQAGVYVLTRDFLCLALGETVIRPAGTSPLITTPPTVPPPEVRGQPPAPAQIRSAGAANAMVVVLQRRGSGFTPRSNGSTGR